MLALGPHTCKTLRPEDFRYRQPGEPPHTQNNFYLHLVSVPELFAENELLEPEIS